MMSWVQKISNPMRVGRCEHCGDYYDPPELRSIVNRKTGERILACVNCQSLARNA